MGYQRLSLNDLQSLANELDRSYNNVKGTNPQRKSFLALLKEVTRTTAGIPDADKIADIITGAAIFELEMISSEYAYLSPEGSDLYNLIKKKLNISSKNPLKDDERLVYLHKFNKYAQATVSDETVKYVKESTRDAVWKNKQDLLKDIHFSLKQLRKRDSARIRELVHGTPNLIALQRNIQNLRNRYHAARNKNRWAMFQSTRRESMCDMSDFIHETCNDFFAQSYRDAAVPDKTTERLQADEYQTRLGLSLTMLLEISSEYRFLSPKGGWMNGGSELYKLMLPMLNITDVKQLQYDEKIGWLRALSMHIDHIRSDSDYYQQLIQQYQRKGIKDLDKQLNKFQVQIDQLRDEQEREKNQPSRTTRVVATGLSYATQCGLMYGVSYAVTQGAARYAITSFGSVIASAIGGPIGLAVYAGSTILMTGLSALVSNNILSATTASLYAWVLEKIGDSVAGAAVGVISYPFSASREGLDKLRRKLSPENEKLFREWVNTLLDLPNDIVSEQEKEQIRNVLGIENDAKLEPLQPLHEEEKKQGYLQKGGLLSRRNNPVIADVDSTSEVVQARWL